MKNIMCTFTSDFFPDRHASINSSAEWFENVFCIIISFLMTFTLPGVFYLSHENFFSLATAGIMLVMVGFELIRNYSLSRKFLFRIFFYIAIAAFYTSFNLKSMGCIKILMFYLPLCIIIFEYVNIQKFANIYVIVTTIFALLFLVSWIATLVGVLKPHGRFMLDWGEGTPTLIYHLLYYNTQRGRNTGIFSEGPVANYYYCISFLFNEFIRKKDRKTMFFRIVYILAILSTRTVTGIMCLLGFALTVFYFSKDKKLRQIKRLAIILFPVILVVFMYAAMIVLEPKLESQSGIVRVTMIQRELIAFREHMLIGNGFSSYSNGSSNSLTSLLADGGVILWFLFYFPLLTHVVIGTKSHDNISIFCMLFLLVFMVSVFQYTLTTCVVLGILYKKLSDINLIKVVT